MIILEDNESKVIMADCGLLSLFMCHQSGFHVTRYPGIQGRTWRCCFPPPRAAFRALAWERYGKAGPIRSQDEREGLQLPGDRTCPPAKVENCWKCLELGKYEQAQEAQRAPRVMPLALDQ